jgi:UDP-2-acetamido-2-deoxy-ribo-hexuluronate aminotransferase
MQFIDLKTQYEKIKDNVDKRIHDVLNHNKYIMGPEITQMEKELAKFAGTKYCVSCASGTDALLMPLMAWEIGEGDAVFTTPFTFVATAEVISLRNATPVFVDIDEDTYNIDPKELEKTIIKVKDEGKLNPKAIIPVDLFGLPANYEEIQKIAKKYDLLLLEDAAQGFGGNINGKRAGSFGDVGATSFFPAKPLGCYGDGGAIFTDSEDMYEKLQSVRVHGQGGDKYDNIRLGLNGRMDSIQAAVIISKLEIFEKELKERNRVADSYTEKLKNKYVTPKVPEGYFSAWAQYSILSESENHRNELQNKLKENGIPSAIYYPIPLHMQTAYKYLNYKENDMPVSESVAKRIFSLPMHPYLKEEEIETICKVLMS